MSNQEQPKIEKLEQKPEAPDVKLLSRLFFLSYKFSQGNVRIQKYIFEYLKTKHLNWRFSEELKEALITNLFDTFQRFAGNSKVHEEQNIEETDQSLRDEVNYLSHVFNKDLENKNLIKILTDSVVELDYKYLIRRGGRPRSESHGLTPATDPFLSHLIYYGFLGHNTGAEEYNGMFREITDYIRFGNLSEEDLNRLKEIIFVWNEKHPDQQVSLEKELGVGV